MKRVLMTFAGSGLAIGFARSLQAAPEQFHIVGLDSNPVSLQRAIANERYLIPNAKDPDYIPILKNLIEDMQPDFLCVNHDREIPVVSACRGSLGVKTFLPAHDTVMLCENKMATNLKWEKDGLPVPKSKLLETDSDLQEAFKEFGNDIWLRAIRGAGGSGSLPVSDYKTAKSWIDIKNGWGNFMAAERLEAESVTWQSVWKNGELLVAQAKKRLHWEFSHVSPSGVTGVTGAAVSVADAEIDELAMAAVRSVDSQPDGIFGVDFTLDRQRRPRLTEINCGRFFTTHHFFTAAGLNMAYIYLKSGLNEPVALPARRLNPLAPGLVWIRGMDRDPILTTQNSIDAAVEDINRRRALMLQKNDTAVPSTEPNTYSTQKSAV